MFDAVVLYRTEKNSQAGQRRLYKADCLRRGGRKGGRRHFQEAQQFSGGGGGGGDKLLPLPPT